MSIGVAVVGLTYLIILVLGYVYSNLPEGENRKSTTNINKAFKISFKTLLFGILIIAVLVILPQIPIDVQTTTYLIVASKFIAVLALGISFYILNKKQRDGSSAS